MGKREAKKERRTSDMVLLALGAFILAFEVCMIALFCRYQSVPDTLIQYTLGAGGIEAVALAGIRISKELSGNTPKTHEKRTGSEETLQETQQESEEPPAETQEETQIENYKRGA